MKPTMESAIIDTSVPQAHSDLGSNSRHTVEESQSVLGDSDHSETSHNGNSSSNDTSGGNDQHRDDNKDLAIAQAEDNAVFRIRLMVVLVLFLCTVVVAWQVYSYTNTAEVDEFEQTFDDDSGKLFEALGSTLDLTMGALDAFVVSIISFSQYSNSSWPFVSLPDFGERMSKVRSLTKAIAITQYPIVTAADRLEWEKYSYANGGWVDECLEVQREDPGFDGKDIETYTALPYIYRSVGPAPYNLTGPFYPSWQAYPVVPTYPPYNFDGVGYPELPDAISFMKKDKLAFLSRAINIPDENDPASVELASVLNLLLKDIVSDDVDVTEPTSTLFYPVYDKTENNFLEDNEQNLVATLAMSIYWRDLLANILPQGSNGIVVVFENACDQTFTYQVDGPDVSYMGLGDQHDPQFDDMGIASTLKDLDQFATGKKKVSGLPLADNACPYTLQIFPSQAMKDRYVSQEPLIFTSVAVCIFLFTSIVFYCYDVLVERRQQKVMRTAVQSSAIVSSLFPSNVRARLFNMEAGDATEQGLHPASRLGDTQRNRLKSFLHTGGKDEEGNRSKSGDKSLAGADRPIADLFPEATVLFADIAGFTAWSSVREPSQVFILLETLYGAFDKIAIRRGVFKVETIGDSYVAVAGLPEPCADHAVVMVKFARDCGTKMHDLTRKLGVSLGPETEDLSMRFGLHSGPVTAGVLRGQKSRFQLFGDTVNTASRMESTGQTNRIQVSQVTADLLIRSSRQHWLSPREEKVKAKGKGMMQTYWVDPGKSVTSNSSVGSHDDRSIGLSSTQSITSDKVERLIDWNADVMSRLIQQIIVRRKVVTHSQQDNGSNHMSVRGFSIVVPSSETKMILEEVKEVIELPDFDPATMDREDDPSTVELEANVSLQLRSYIEEIAQRYHTNAFHSFEHASHVGMSVAKLMNRIVAAEDVYDQMKPDEQQKSIASSKHDHTYGITSDPLTQFACVFSALIHDVDHQGVPNTQLVKEEQDLAAKYQGRSVAEQNSVAIAWDIFMQDKYEILRATICPTSADRMRFRQLVVNCVMATDIMDKELKNLRNQRWDKAFDSQNQSNCDQTNVNRKATIVIEHLIQASDVAHTMQHWHIYRKWNERLFQEMYKAFEDGRAEKNPAEFWYKGELGFFDFYIIPLAKKLSECGVFGVSSDEYLNYAMKNREEWEIKGEKVVALMVKKLEKSS